MNRVQQVFKLKQTKTPALLSLLIFVIVWIIIGWLIFVNFHENKISASKAVTIQLVLLIVGLYICLPRDTGKYTITIDDNTITIGSKIYQRTLMKNAYPYESKYNNMLTSCGIEFLYYPDGLAGKEVKKRIETIYFNKDERNNIHSLLLQSISTQPSTFMPGEYEFNLNFFKWAWKRQIRISITFFFCNFIGGLCGFSLLFSETEIYMSPYVIMGFCFGFCFIYIMVYFLRWLWLSRYVISISPNSIMLVNRKNLQIKLSARFDDILNFEDYNFKSESGKIHEINIKLTSGETKSFDITGYENENILVQKFRENLSCYRK